jgi:hypothetical protein
MTKIRTCAPGQLEVPPRHPGEDCGASTFLHATIWKEGGEEHSSLTSGETPYQQHQNKTQFLGAEAP